MTDQLCVEGPPADQDHHSAQLQQGALSHVQSGCEHLQRQRLCLSALPTPVSNQPQSKKNGVL